MQLIVKKILMRCTPVLAGVCCLAAAQGCHTLDDERIPPYAANLVFRDVADWNFYGTPAALDHRRFILSEHVPANYNYTIGEATGYGGILLVGDLFGAPRAYDLSCPVECRTNVRIVVDTEKNNAYCPMCGSVYDIYTNYGQPIGGEAAELGYGLRQYYVGAGGAGEYMVVRNFN